MCQYYVLILHVFWAYDYALMKTSLIWTFNKKDLVNQLLAITSLVYLIVGVCLLGHSCIVSGFHWFFNFIAFFKI